MNDRERNAPAKREDMEAFAQRLRADPAMAREFFRGAGILGPDGELAPEYRSKRVSSLDKPMIGVTIDDEKIDRQCQRAARFIVGAIWIFGGMGIVAIVLRLTGLRG